MKKNIFFVFLLVLTTNTVVFSQSIETKVREFAMQKYPNDREMREYVYRNQMAAYNYMLLVADQEVEKFAVSKYPSDYEMQQYTYDN